MDFCLRCQTNKAEEHCWRCANRTLCIPCWEAYGCCEADEGTGECESLRLNAKEA